MAARILDGKSLSKILKDELAQHFHIAINQGLTPKLAIVFVGDDPASAVYARSKVNACKAAGANVDLLTLASSTSEQDLLATLDALNRDNTVHGIFIEMPLPSHITEARIRRAISPLKDVDGIHPENIGLLAMSATRFAPCTPLGVTVLLDRMGIPTHGKHVVILGRSNVIGRPLALLLLQRGSAANATITVCHTRTPDPKLHARQGDIVVAALGQREMVTAEWIKEGAVVVDVGIHDKDGKLVGDVDFESVRERASAITPVPGGVGALTVTILLNNLLKAACVSCGLDSQTMKLL